MEAFLVKFNYRVILTCNIYDQCYRFNVNALLILLNL